MQQTLCRRLKSSDAPSVIALIQSRMEAGSRVSLSSLPSGIEDLKVRMANSDTYRMGYVFGVFREDRLRAFCLINTLTDWCYLFMMFMSERTAERKPLDENGFNTDTQAMMDYALRAMERRGYYVLYSAIPASKRWKNVADNPNRVVKDEYETSVIETVLPNQMPVSRIGRMLRTRPHERDVLILQRRRKAGRAI